MKLKFVSPHIVEDCGRTAGEVLDPPPQGYQVTPLMEGLDDEALAVVEYAKLKVWGRYPWPYGLYPPSGQPLDDPPIADPQTDRRQPAGVSLHPRQGVPLMPLSTD